MEPTSLTLSPILSADELAPVHFTALTALEELHDYKLCFKQIEKNKEDLDRISHNVFYRRSRTSKKSMKDHEAHLLGGMTSYRQSKNFQRKLNTLSPHEVKKDLFKEFQKMAEFVSPILNQSMKKLNKAFYGPPRNLSIETKNLVETKDLSKRTIIKREPFTA